MKTTREQAGSWNKFLLDVYEGVNDEYETLEDFIDSAYDVTYIVKDRQNLGVKMLLAGGGPTVWLDTYDGMIYVSDSGDCVGMSLFSEVNDAINDMFGIVY